MMKFTTHVVMVWVLSSLIWAAPSMADCAKMELSDQGCCCSAPVVEVEASCCASEAPTPAPKKGPCGCHIQASDGALPEAFQFVLPGSSNLIKIIDVEQSTPLMVLDEALSGQIMAFSTADSLSAQHLMPSMTCIFIL